jgi:hypothetical protein
VKEILEGPVLSEIDVQTAFGHRHFGDHHPFGERAGAAGGQ